MGAGDEAALKVCADAGMKVGWSRCWCRWCSNGACRVASVAAVALKAHAAVMLA